MAKCHTYLLQLLKLRHEATVLRLQRVTPGLVVGQLRVERVHLALQAVHVLLLLATALLRRYL